MTKTADWTLVVNKVFDGRFRVGSPIPNQMFRVYGYYRDEEQAQRRVSQIERSRRPKK